MILENAENLSSVFSPYKILKLHDWADTDISSRTSTQIWTAMYENVPADICGQQRLRSACASTQFHHSQMLARWHEETLRPWLSKIRPVKILIRLRESYTHTKVRFLTLRLIFGPMAEKRKLRTYANSEDPDQTAHPRSLVRIFAADLPNIETLLKI